ncbi:MAG: hypothetical protein WC654_02705 [Patescibacteria group bacterium]
MHFMATKSEVPTDILLQYGQELFERDFRLGIYSLAYRVHARVRSFLSRFSEYDRLDHHADRNICDNWGAFEKGAEQFIWFLRPPGGDLDTDGDSFGLFFTRKAFGPRRWIL